MMMESDKEADPPELPPKPWHVAVGESKLGPYDLDDMTRLLKEGRVTARSLVWRKGMPEWRPLGATPELAPLAAKAEALGAQAGKLLGEAGQAVRSKAMEIKDKMESTPPADRSFLETMLDFSFNSFITVRFIRFLYGLGLLMNLLGTVAYIVGVVKLLGLNAAMNDHFTHREGEQLGLLIQNLLFALVSGGVVFCCSAVLIRLVCELSIVHFKSSENLARIAERAERQA